jgi:hypothetical protein
MQSGLLLEHTFRFFKQTLGWDAPLLRDPAAADRWTWLIIAACTQLRLAAALAADLRLPWQRPQLPGTLTPARVRRGFRRVRDTVATPAAPPKPCKPGPGRPKGSKNRHQAPRHDVGKRNPKGKKRTKQRANTRPGRVGWPGTSQSRAPAEPCLTVSRYTALLIFSSRTASPTPSA